MILEEKVVLGIYVFLVGGRSYFCFFFKGDIEGGYVVKIYFIGDCGNFICFVFWCF